MEGFGRVQKIGTRPKKIHEVLPAVHRQAHRSHFVPRTFEFSRKSGFPPEEGNSMLVMYMEKVDKRMEVSFKSLSRVIGIESEASIIRKRRSSHEFSIRPAGLPEKIKRADSTASKFGLFFARQTTESLLQGSSRLLRSPRCFFRDRTAPERKIQFKARTSSRVIPTKLFAV